VQGVDVTARECLKWKYKGNGHLEEGEASLAIDAYDQALATCFSEQEGIVLLMRATAYLKLASIHQQELQELVSDLSQSMPDTSSLQQVYEEAARHPSLAMALFERVISDSKLQDRKFRKTKFRHGLYQYALLHAARDSLRATQLLPNYSNVWLRAGEILSELWKLKESANYHEKAYELDPELTDSLSPVVERLRKRQELLDSARAYGWSEDTLRLALDVAG
jgi:tetratricopeptide (TPR) repeat protein